ncbi:MAG: exo-alpha-sialidase, partial [Clostridia bacterium]|nr:exo-alpha-sialidase [Clostridia bacterium]
MNKNSLPIKIAALAAAVIMLFTGCAKEDNGMQRETTGSSEEFYVTETAPKTTAEKDPPTDPVKYTVEFGEKFLCSGGRGLFEKTDGTLLSTRVERSDAEGIKKIYCVECRNPNAKGTDIGLIATEDVSADFGDCGMLAASDGTVYCSFRVNKYNYPTNGNSLHEIRVCKSTDGGKTWEAMKPVASHTAHMTGYNQNEIRGLWSQFLFETSKGDIQCYYDDENICWEAGYKGHQWWMMKTLDKEKREWSEPVCVSRTYGNLLVRDGMGAVAETSDG